MRKTVCPERRFISPRKPDAPWRTISWPAASSHRDLALDDRDERIALVADLEQRLADLGGPLLAVLGEHRELRAREHSAYRSGHSLIPTGRAGCVHAREAAIRSANLAGQDLIGQGFQLAHVADGKREFAR